MSAAKPAIVTPEQWRAAREALLKKEKAHTRARDAMAADTVVGGAVAAVVGTVEATVVGSVAPATVVAVRRIGPTRRTGPSSGWATCAPRPR